MPQWEVEGEEEVPERKERWRVCVRWLRDSYKFNEWMNELDYEPDEDGEKRAGRWDAEEDSMLWQAYKELGRDFVSIRKRLVARPVASIKGRLKILINKEEKRKADAAAGIVEEEGAGGKKEKKEKAKKEGEKGKRDADGAAKGGGGGGKERGRGAISWDERACKTRGEPKGERHTHIQMSLTLPPALAAAKNSVTSRMTKRIVAVLKGALCL